LVEQAGVLDLVQVGHLLGVEVVGVGANIDANDVVGGDVASGCRGCFRRVSGLCGGRGGRGGGSGGRRRGGRGRLRGGGGLGGGRGSRRGLDSRCWRATRRYQHGKESESQNGVGFSHCRVLLRA